MSQYDIELYQRIEHLIGKKLPLYETVDDEVMAFRDGDEIMIRFQHLLFKIILLGDNSGKLQPPVDLVPTVLAASGPLL